MNTHKFLDDLQSSVANGRLTQNEIVSKSGLTQGAISKLINGRSRHMPFETAISLWPILYGRPFPDRPPEANNAR